MTFTVDGKTYQLQYSVEAFITKYVDEDGRNVPHVLPLIKMADGDADEYSALNIPDVVCHAMYAGLLKHHGMGRHADHSITCFEDAAEICMALIDENPDDERYNTWSSLIKLCTDQMSEDRFFEKFADTKKKVNATKKN